MGIHSYCQVENNIFLALYTNIKPEKNSQLRKRGIRVRPLLAQPVCYERTVVQNSGRPSDMVRSTTHE